MRTTSVLLNTVVWLGLLGFCIASAGFAAELAPQPVVIDIALADGGTVHGQLIDLQGGRVAGVPVSLETQSRAVAATTTTADGRFTAQGLRGGVYHVATAQGQGTYRFWSPGTAPPSARNNAIVYTQNGVGGFTPSMLLTNPIVVGSVVGSVVAAPIAVVNSRHASP
jgi:hypothetical protein